MSRRAWFFVLGIIAIGAVLSLLVFMNSVPGLPDWAALCVLGAFATWSQLGRSVFKGRSREDVSISASPLLVFLAAGVFLLPPWQFVVLVLFPHAVEWVIERYRGSLSLSAWYIQAFNIANHVCCGFAARAGEFFVSANLPAGEFPTAAAALSAILLYLMLNHVLIAFAVVLARGVSWNVNGMLEWDTLMPNLLLLVMGYSLALLWEQSPWLILFGLAPVVLIRQALAVPQLRKEAQFDAKTGLYNAAHFSRLFRREMERAGRFAHPLSLIMVDLDLLRNVNNTYGHLAGDTVLACIGQIIRQVLRKYDIAGRFGGEEFTVVLAETRQDAALVVAQRLRQTIAATPITVRTNAQPIHVTASFGVASFPADATEPDDLIHQADVAVYQAKLQGRNCVVCFEDVPPSARLEIPGAEARTTRGQILP